MEEETGTSACHFYCLQIEPPLRHPLGSHHSYCFMVEIVYCPQKQPLVLPLDRDLLTSGDYKILAVARMTEAWKLAKDRIEIAQN